MSNSCLKKALQILTRRDHSLAELSNKLKKQGFVKQEIQDAVDECLRLNYLDDQRFACSYLKQLQRMGYGINRIKQKLYSKGIPEEIIGACIESHCEDNDQLEACKLVLAKKIAQLRGSNSLLELCPKLQRFLYGRGFSYPTIHKAMEETIVQEDL